MKKIFKTKKGIISLVSIVVVASLVTGIYVYTEMKPQTIELKVAGEKKQVEVNKDDSIKKLVEKESAAYESIVIETIEKDQDEIKTKELERDKESSMSDLSTIDIETIKIEKSIVVKINGKETSLKKIDKKKHSNINTIEIDIYEKIEKTDEEVIKFENEDKNDDSMYKDESKIETAGVDGKNVRTYNYVFKNGIQVDDEEINFETTEPITQVTLVGTKDRPSGYVPNKGNNGSSGSSSSGNSGGISSGGGNSGGNYSGGSTGGLTQAQCDAWVANKVAELGLTNWGSWYGGSVCIVDDYSTGKSYYK